MRKLSPVSRAESSLTLEARTHARALGAVLRKARTSRGISRQQLGGRVLIGTATLQRMESGDPRVSLGYYLAVGLELGIPVLATQASTLLGAEAMADSRKTRASRKRSRDEWFS